jgi:pimeloyl-ACP methyl ester carboxylesterase
MHWPARFSFSTARGTPWLTQLVYGGFVGQFMYLYPEVALGMLMASMGEADRRTLARQEIYSALCASLREGFRQGTRGPLLDMALYSEEWGFDPMDIAIPVTFWHGEADMTVPVSHTHLVAKGIPRATVRILSEEGHFSLPIDHADKILKTLLDR